MAGFDVRRYVADVRCPALVTHALGDRMVHPGHGRWYAGQLTGSEHWVWATVRDLLMSSTLVAFASLGEFDLKGIDGAWELFVASPT